MIKKIFCLALSVSMALSVFSLDVFAAGEATNDADNAVAPLEVGADGDELLNDNSEATEGLEGELDKVATAEDATWNFKATVGDKTVSLDWSDYDATELADVSYDVTADGVDPANISVNTEQKNAVVSNLENNKEYEFKIQIKDGEDVKAESSVKATPKAPEVPIGNVENLRLLSDYISITAKWNTVKDAKGYRFELYEKDKKIRTWDKLTSAYGGPVKVSGNVTSYRIKYISNSNKKMPEGHKYTLKVAAFNNYTIAGNDKIAPEKIGKFVTSKEAKGPVSALYVKFKGKKARTPYYKTSKGKSVKGYLKKGKVYTAQGFICGRYRLQLNGKTYYVPKIYGTLVNSGYNKNKADNYTREEAELFINHKRANYKDKSGYLVWISLHDQHIYVFKGKKNNWKLTKVPHSLVSNKYSLNNDDYSHWEVATGKIPTSATATGKWTVKRKIPSRHSLKYWTVFYSGVATHSWGNPKCFGKPQSGGCTRNTVPQAKYIYQRMSTGMTVITY